MRKCLWILAIGLVVYLCTLLPFAADPAQNSDAKSPAPAPQAAANQDIPPVASPVKFSTTEYTLMYSSLNEIMQGNILESITQLLGRGAACDLQPQSLHKKLKIIQTMVTEKELVHIQQKIQQQRELQASGSSGENCDTVRATIAEVEKQSSIVD